MVTPATRTVPHSGFDVPAAATLDLAAERVEAVLRTLDEELVGLTPTGWTCSSSPTPA
ncbi:MAG: hypothetical protein KY451_09080 [Actinobacteria bacterium]|nr:hypothetical protein [Actinomycetota bacterium]